MSDLENSDVLMPEEIERYRSSPLRPILPLLRQGLYHRTGPESCLAILADGALKPNTGSLEFTCRQTPHYFAFSKGYISLFDFEVSTEIEMALTLDTWQPFFFDRHPFTVLLRFERSRLESRLIPNSSGPEVGASDYKGYIPYVEAWYPQPILVADIESGIIIADQGLSEPVLYFQVPLDSLEDTVRCCLGHVRGS